MVHRQFAEHTLSLQGERQQHFTPVILCSFPPDVATTLKPVNQFYCAVMLDLHLVGQFSNPRPHTFRHTFDGEQHLVLARFKARRPYRLLAEAQKLSNLEAKPGQGPVIGNTQLSHAAIVSRRDSASKYIVKRYIRESRPSHSVRARSLPARSTLDGNAFLHGGGRRREHQR